MNENITQLVLDLLVVFVFWVPFIMVLVMVGARGRKKK